MQKEGPAKGKRNGVMPCTREKGSLLSTQLMWHHCPDDPNIDVIYHGGPTLIPSFILLHHSLTRMSGH